MKLNEVMNRIIDNEILKCAQNLSDAIDESIVNSYDPNLSAEDVTRIFKESLNFSFETVDKMLLEIIKNEKE